MFWYAGDSLLMRFGSVFMGNEDFFCERSVLFFWRRFCGRSLKWCKSLMENELCVKLDEFNCTRIASWWNDGGGGRARKGKKGYFVLQYGLNDVSIWAEMSCDYALFWEGVKGLFRVKRAFFPKEVGCLHTEFLFPIFFEEALFASYFDNLLKRCYPKGELN